MEFGRFTPGTSPFPFNESESTAGWLGFFIDWPEGGRMVRITYWLEKAGEAAIVKAYQDAQKLAALVYKEHRLTPEEIIALLVPPAGTCTVSRFVVDGDYRDPGSGAPAAETFTSRSVTDAVFWDDNLKKMTVLTPEQKEARDLQFDNERQAAIKRKEFIEGIIIETGPLRTNMPLPPRLDSKKMRKNQEAREKKS